MKIQILIKNKSYKLQSEGTSLRISNLKNLLINIVKIQ